MDNVVKDVIQIKRIERIIGRKLEDLDFEAIYMHEPIYFQKANGELISFFVHLYILPYDLMNKELEMAIVLRDYEPKDFFDYAFSKGHMTAVTFRG